MLNVIQSVNLLIGLMLATTLSLASGVSGPGGVLTVSGDTVSRNHPTTVFSTQSADRPVLKYVEPLRFRDRDNQPMPTRLYVEFRNERGAFHTFAPCSPDRRSYCFRWTPRTKFVRYRGHRIVL